MWIGCHGLARQGEVEEVLGRRTVKEWEFVERKLGNALDCGDVSL